MDDSNRIPALDFLRGIAVMGMVFAMLAPSAIPATPTDYVAGPLDGVLWLIQFLLVDSEFPALIAMVFGASILLVIEASELSGLDGMRAHRRRLLALLPFGAASALMLGHVDMLLPLALAGLIATPLLGHEPLDLIKWALGVLAVQWVLALAVVAVAPGVGQLFLFTMMRSALDGSPQSLGPQGLGMFVIEQGAHLLVSVPALVAFITLGMAMLKGGFLSAQWTADQYRATWRRAYLVGLVPMIGLAAWVLFARDPMAARTWSAALSVPLAFPLAAAHAALIMEIAVRNGESGFARAVRSVGRLALSNALLLGLVVTALDWARHSLIILSLDRVSLTLVAVAFGGGMLIWSYLWLARFPAGPAEWLWRRLAGWKA